jgi:hypothetical protein
MSLKENKVIKSSHTKNKQDILRQNLNDLNSISGRLLDDIKLRNSILQKGLNETKNNTNIVTNMKGGNQQ